MQLGSLVFSISLLSFLASVQLHSLVYDKIVAANAAGNMAAPLLAQAIGGEFLFAFVSAVAFATILAVVAGLVLSAASAFAHDFYGHIIRKGKCNR